MKLGFLSRIYLAITDFRLYPFVAQKEKWITSLAYFFALLALVSLVIAISMTSKFFGWLSLLEKEYSNLITDFSMKENQLVTEGKTDTDLKNVRIYISDENTLEETQLKNIDVESYRFFIAGYRDAIAFGQRNFGYFAIKYSDIEPALDKQMLYDWIHTTLHQGVMKYALVGMFFCVIYVAMLISKCINLLGVIIILFLLGKIFKTNYRLRDFAKVGCYVLTLPIITEMIAIMVVGELNDYANVTYYLLVYVYVFYAIRALKLDNILMATQEKIMGFKDEADKINAMLKENQNQGSSDAEKENDKEENKSASGEHQSKEGENENGNQERRD